MATVSANELSLEKTLEELITEFNTLRGDVSAVTLEVLISTASSQAVFEGATDDANETTLTVVDPTADRTITLPDATGTVVTTANADAGATTTTFADLDQFLINDGGVLKKMALSTFAASLPALTPDSANANALGSASLEWSDLFLGDSSVISFGNDQDTTLTHTDGAGLTLNSTNKLMFNDASQFIQGASATILDIAATDEIELTATLIDVVGNLAVSGTLVGASTIQGTTITATTAVVPDASDGAALGTSALEWSDLFLADGAIINFGDDQEVTLTHVHNDGIIISSTDKIMFNTTSQFIHGVSDAILDIAATDEIELTATLIDVVGNFAISGTVVGASTIQGTTITATTAFVPDAQDGAALGTTSLQFSDLFLADSAVIGFGDDNDTTLTHTDGAGLTLNSTNKLMFNDASQFIQGVSATVLDIAATDEIELTATLIDVVGNFTISGTVVGASTIQGTTITATTAFVPDAQDGAALGTSSLQFSDLFLADSAAMFFGDNNEVALTHIHDTGLLLNAAMVLQFRDSAINIGSPADGDLDINADDEIELNSTLIDINGNLDVSGTIVGASTISGTAITASTSFLPDAQDGAALGTTSLQFSDLFLADGAVIGFGDNNEVTLTHVHDTGILLNSTMAIQFNDASQFINAPSNAILDINATDEIELNATLVDINANVEISGNLSVAGTTTTVDTVTMNAQNAVIFEGATADNNETTLTITDPTTDRTITLPDETGTVHTSGGSIAIPNGGTIGSAGDADAIAIASGGGVTLTQTLVGTAADFSGVATATTFEPDGDTAAGDNAAIGFTAAEGLILTGQGSTSDITLKNDADAVVFTVPTGTDDILFPDSAKILLGAGSDLQIYHDGSNSYIADAGTGDLYIRASNAIVIEAANGENYITGVFNGAVELYHNNVVKLATESDGITVTGTVTATAGATLLIKNAAGTTLKTIKGMT